MTLAEFKAWFEGFTEDMDGAPSKKQFERIKEKVAKIDGTPLTPLVIREYYDRYRPYWQYNGWSANLSAAGTSDVIYNNIAMVGQNVPGGTGGEKFAAALQLHDLGKAEYKAMQ